MTQDNLPNFDKEYTIAQQKSIPIEARKRHLMKKYWQYRAYFEKTGNWKNHKRAEQIAGFIQQQRGR